MTVRGALIAGFASALLLSFGCGGSDTGSGPAPPTLACTDGGAAAANTVIMSCGGPIDGTTEKVNVVLGGPAAPNTTTLRGLNFDVTYDPAKLEFVPAASYVSPLFPDAFVLAVLANGQQGRVVAAIQQPGDLAAVSVATGEHDVLSLSFRRVAGATFGPTPLTFERAQATAALPAISFASGLALEYP